MAIKRGRKGRGGRKQAEKSFKFTSFIHRPSAWHHCPTRATKEIKSTHICMWKVQGLWLCIQKAKELWFQGIFNLHSDCNKGLAVGLRAPARADWGRGRVVWGVWDHRPHLFSLFTLPLLCIRRRALTAPSPSSPRAQGPPRFVKASFCGFNV